MTDWLEDDALADQYEDSSNLAARQVVHARFSTAEQSRHEWLFDQFDLPADADVLSLGAGQGVLWATNADRIPAGWDVTVTDAFQGMVFDAMETLEEVDREFHFDVVDACDIPYPEDSFDAVTANHVLSPTSTTPTGRPRSPRPGASCDLAASVTRRRTAKRISGNCSASPASSGSCRTRWRSPGERRRPVSRGVRRRGTASLRRRTQGHCPEPLVAYALSLPGYEPSDAHELGRAFRERVGDDAMRVTGTSASSWRADRRRLFRLSSGISPMRKTLLGPGAGTVDSAELDHAVHSVGVATEHDGYTRVCLSGSPPGSLVSRRRSATSSTSWGACSRTSAARSTTW